MTEKDEYFMHRAIQMAEKGMDSNAGGAFSLTGSPQYRFGYQGQFAEKDPETGLNSFEARMYDARIGRWQTIDPARQYWSPYLGMGNKPMNSVDPDGRDVWENCTRLCWFLTNKPQNIYKIKD